MLNEAKRKDNRLIHDVLAEAARVDGDERILIRWVVICDWEQEDGDRALTRVRSEASTEWEAEGLLHAGIKNDWGNDEDDD